MAWFHWPAWYAHIWCLVAFAALLSRVVRSQQRETESDLRAVELCGDGEALIRALTVIHTRARVPRRFQPEVAARATHPSLARRIQAIRAASGVAPGPIAPGAFAADGAPRAVVFEAERLVFASFGDDRPDLADHVGLVLRARHVEAIAYADLSSLHLEPRRDGGATLVAADRHDEPRRLQLADADLVAVQALMDVVDQRIGPPSVPQLPQLAGRVAAIAAFFVALPLLAWAVTATAILALLKPTTPALASMAAGLVATAVVAARQPSSPWQVPALTLIALFAGAVVVRQIRADRNRATPFRRDGVLVAASLATGAAALIPLSLIVAFGHADLPRLHLAARAFASGVSGFAALGGLCLVVPRRRARIAAAVAFTAAIAIAAVGSRTFRDRVVPDPLATAAPSLTVRELGAATNGRLSVRGLHHHLILAPDAQHAILTPTRDESRADAGRWMVAGFDGWQREIDADNVLFVDAGTLLVARWERGAIQLSTEPIRAAEPRWRLRIEDAPAGDVDVDPSGRWRLEPDLDVDERSEDPARIEGHVGTPQIVRTPLARLATADSAPERHVAASGAALTVTREFVGSWHGFGWLLPDAAWRSVLARTGGTAPGILARSRTSVDCYGPSLTSGSATCLATTGDETFIWEVPADAGAPRPLAELTGRVAGSAYEDRVLLLWHERDLLLLWRGTSEALRIAARGRCPCAHDASYAGGHVATLTRVGERDVVTRVAYAPP